MLTLGFWLEWLLLLGQVESLEFNWSKYEWPWYASLKSSLKTGWDVEIKVLLGLRSCLDLFNFLGLLLLSTLSLLLCLCLGLLGSLYSLLLRLLLSFLQGTSSLLKLSLLICVLSETPRVETCKSTCEVFLILGLVAVLVALKDPFVGSLHVVKVEDTMDICHVIA